MPKKETISRGSKASKKTTKVSTKPHCSRACDSHDDQKGSKRAGACRCASKGKTCSSWKAYVNQLLEHIGRGQGVSDLKLDENNNCMLLFNEKVVLNMDLDENGGVLVVYAYIGEVPLECRDVIYEKALEENFFWRGTAGGTFGRDKQSQSMVLSKAYQLPLADFGVFEEQLSKFVDVAEKWISRIENCENIDENF